jgi:hypothetical protein
MIRVNWEKLEKVWKPSKTTPLAKKHAKTQPSGKQKHVYRLYTTHIYKI